jgi:Fic family protein
MDNVSIVEFDNTKFPFHLTKDDEFMEALISTEIALARYNQLLEQMKNLPSNLLNLFLTPLEKKEAQITSKIEGTVTSLQELYDYDITNKDDNKGTNKEVNQYTEAIKYAQKQIDSGHPLNEKLLREIHQELLTSVRGKDKSPGNYKKFQNYIQNSKLGHYKPCDPVDLPIEMEKLFKIIKRVDIESQSKNPQLIDDIPGIGTLNNPEEEKIKEKNILINIAMIHAQFESIHPFDDGNGRIGRMLITLLLWKFKKIAMPNFYISSYLEDEKTKDKYFSALRGVDTKKDWKNWYLFFFKAVKSASEKNHELAVGLRDLHTKTLDDLSDLIPSTSNHDKKDKRKITLNFLFEKPNFPASEYYLGEIGSMGRKYLKRLEEKKIITEIMPAKGSAPAQYVFEAFFKLIK